MKKLVLLTLLVSPISSADNLWMDCGIGHWIAGPTLNGFPAMTTNLAFDLGTTATISDISTPSICAGPFWASARFIYKSYPMLEEETAAGNGDYMTAMLDHFECESDTNATIRTNIRKNFFNVINQPNYSQNDINIKAATYYQIVSNEIKKHSQSCKLI